MSAVNSNPVIGIVIIARHGDREGMYQSPCPTAFLYHSSNSDQNTQIAAPTSSPRAIQLTYPLFALPGFYQDPKTYTATSTAITPVGEVQEYQLGSLLRSIYVNTSSPHYVTGLNPVTLIDPQINSTVDGGGEGSVVFDSAVALFQGLYPPNPA